MTTDDEGTGKSGERKAPPDEAAEALSFDEALELTEWHAAHLYLADKLATLDLNIRQYRRLQADPDCAKRLARAERQRAWLLRELRDYATTPHSKASPAAGLKAVELKYRAQVGDGYDIAMAAVEMLTRYIKAKRIYDKHKGSERSDAYTPIADHGGWTAGLKQLRREAQHDQDPGRREGARKHLELLKIHKRPRSEVAAKRVDSLKSSAIDQLVSAMGAVGLVGDGAGPAAKAKTWVERAAGPVELWRRDLAKPGDRARHGVAHALEHRVTENGLRTGNGAAGID